MNNQYNDPVIPKDVADIIKEYRDIAEKQQSTEASILYWILDDKIQNGSSCYTPTMHWIENNIADLAIAIQTNRYTIGASTFNS